MRGGQENRPLVPGLLGTNPIAISDYFVEAGYGVCMTSDPKRMDELSSIASASILYYMYTYTNKSGNLAIGHHYIEYHPTGNGDYRAVNADTYSGDDIFTSPGKYAEKSSVAYIAIFIF